MREPCRVCGACGPGGPCRWLFSTCGRFRLSVVLSHVLESDLQRDGRGEFLCGKCVFLLERVVDCDVAIANLQDAHAAQVRQLQNEREALIGLITRKYQQNNPREPASSGQQNQNQRENSQIREPDRERKDHLSQHGPNQLKVQQPQRPTHQQSQSKQRRNETKQVVEPKPNRHRRFSSGARQGTRGGCPKSCSLGLEVIPSKRATREGQLRRCVSLEPLVGVPAERSSCFGRSLVGKKGKEAGLKAGRVQGNNREYMDLLHKRSVLPRSVSLQSLAPERAERAPPLRQTRLHRGSSHTATETSLLVSDLLQLLRCVRARPLPLSAGSRIPVRLQPIPALGHAQMGGARRERAERVLKELEEEFNDEYLPLKKELCMARQGDLERLQQVIRQLTEELNSTKSSSQTLKHRLEEMDNEKKALTGQLEEKEGELAAEKRNALKRDKTIQGLGLLLKEKEKEVEELYGNLEEKDQALTKAREALHKAQLQKYQGAEEQQALLLSQQAELSRLQAEAHASLLETQRLQRLLGSRDAELALLQQDKAQLEQELELLQQQKRKGDKTINDLQNQLKKLIGELEEKENSLQHQHLEQQEQNRKTEHKLQSTIQHLTTSLTQKEQQLQEYKVVVQDLEQGRAPGGSDVMLAKLRERLREKEMALEKALDDKFAAVEEKENEVHLLQLSVREKERDVERLTNLLTHNEETINSFDALLKEKDVELQKLLNSLKNMQRSKQESEDNLQRGLREKDAIIQQLQHTLEIKSKDMEELASTVLSQSEAKGRDLAEQMAQRLKVSEAMLAGAVKDRERLVQENQTAVENLLSTISSKEQLLKESEERHAETLKDLQRQLADAQLQLRIAKQPGSAPTSDVSLEMTQLRTALAEKEAVINKLLERSQERDHSSAEVKLGEAMSAQVKLGEGPPPQVLELRQTIQVLQERLDEREAELSRRNSEENMEKSVTVSKKSAVILKKELAQKTDALNSALKRENQLKINLAELQLTVSELEARLEGQAANVESLTSTLSTKEDIIAELQQCLARRGESRPPTAQEQHSQPGDERGFPSLPQRERTVIGGDRQQEALPSLGDLRSEQTELNRILRAEQQLYSNLVRAVKEQDSAQRLQALQLELAAVTLLRQQLEDGIRGNEELRDQLHREIQRANQREGADPAELESMRDALEEAQRWNASLQARLGQIQSRGGGVGQANDTADTLSLIGEQTSYMSICVGEGPEEDHLSLEQLRLKVSELQAGNAELQRRLALAERGIVGDAQSESQEDPDLIDFSSPSKQTQGLLKPLGDNANKMLAAQDLKKKLNESTQSDEAISKSALPTSTQSLTEKEVFSDVSEHSGGVSEQAELASLLTDCGAGSISQLREQISKLRLEASELRGLLKEENAAESKESAEGSGDSDGHADLRHTVQTLRSEAKSHRKVIRLLKEQLQRNTAVEGGPGFDPELIVSMAREMERLRAENEASKKHVVSLEDRLKEKQTLERNKEREEEEEREREDKETREQRVKLTKTQKHQMAKHAAYVRSRLPVPANPKRQTDRSKFTENDMESLEYRSESTLESGTDSEHTQFNHRYPNGAEHHSSQGSSSEALWSTDARGKASQEAKQNADAKHKADKVAGVLESDLITQLELLNQECQEKEELISQLQLQVREWEGLQAELQEKDRLIGQYLEALQAAESTIAYLTACNLDSESGLGQSGSGSDSPLQRQVAELQKEVQEKDQLNAQLLECLNTAESAIASLTAPDRPESPPSPTAGQGDPQELCDRLEVLLGQIRAFQDRRDAPTGTEEGSRHPDGSSAHEADLRRQAEALQESLLHQCRLNSELQEKLRTAEETITKIGSNADTLKPNNAAVVVEKDTSQGPQEEKVFAEGQDKLIACLSECILAAEQAVECLVDFGSRCDQPSCDSDLSADEELQRNLERLHRALLERDGFGDPSSADINQSTIVGPLQYKPVHTLQVSYAEQQKTSTPISQGQQNQKSLSPHQRGNEAERWGGSQTGATHLNLHRNLGLLLQILKDRAQKILDLEEGCGFREEDRVEDEEVRHERDLELETLQEALKEKQNMCENLEEKLATAQTIIALQKSEGSNKSVNRWKAPPGERDEKGVQVDAQDLGYETNGRSETEVESSTEVDGSASLGRVLSPNPDQALAGFSSVDNLDTTLSSPSYPSSPDLSSPRPCDPSTERADRNADPTLLRQQLQDLRSQVEDQQKVIQHLQRLLRKKSLSAEALSVISDPVGREEEEREAIKAQIAHLTMELEKERAINRSQSASPSKFESLVQAQARELCELREQIRASHALGAGQRQQLLELRGTLEELLQPSNRHPAMDTTLRQHLDHSLSLLGKLEKGDASHPGNEKAAELELAQSESVWLLEELQCLRAQLEGDREQQHLQMVYLCQQNQNLALATQQHTDLLSAELRERDVLIQQLRDQLRAPTPRTHQDSDSEMSDRLSNEGTASFHESPTTRTPHRATTGLKVTNGIAEVRGEADASEDVAATVRTLQRENGRLLEQLRTSEELNATLKSELDLTRSVLAHTHEESSPSVTRTHTQSPATDREAEQQNQDVKESGSKSGISADLLAEHLQEVRALRQRLEETIRTNERLREQLEKKLKEAEKDPATNIFIGGSEESVQLTTELQFLRAQNHTLKEQLNIASRDKQRENDRLRETLARRTAKLELSRKECDTLQQERTNLQDSLHRLQSESKVQKQQLADTQQLLQSVRVELQVHEQIRNSTHTHTGEEHSGSDSGKVDLSELLAEVRKLRLQLERSIQTNTALRHKLEQQLLTRTDGPSTININYLLSNSDGGKSELPHPLLHTDPCSSTAHDSGSSVGSGSPTPSRLVPGHRLWADRHGRHILGLIEDYNALRKQISEAKRLNTVMDTQLQESSRVVDCKALSGSVCTMQQVLEEAGRLLKLLWRVSLPSGEFTLSQQDEVLRNEISRLRSRLAQQERLLTGAVKRLRSTNQLKEGMERIIIDQLSLTHGVLKRARGNLESNYHNVFGLKGLQMEGNPTERPVTYEAGDSSPRFTSTPRPNSVTHSEAEPHSDGSSHCSC